MQIKQPDLDEFISPAELARRTDTSPQFWADQRMHGTGPKYVKLGNTEKSRVRYRWCDVVAWMEQHYATTDED